MNHLKMNLRNLKKIKKTKVRKILKLKLKLKNK